MPGPYQPPYQSGDEAFPGAGQLENLPAPPRGGVIVNQPANPRGRLDPRWFRLVDEKDTGRRGRGWDTNGGHRNYIRIFLVVTWDVEMSIQAVCSAPGLPRPYSAYQSRNQLEYDLAAYAVAADAEQFDDDRHHWLVTIYYSTDVTPRDPHENPGWADLMEGEMNQPWLQKPEFEWDSEEASVALARDLDGKAFLNSALQPFTPAPMFPQDYAVLVIKRNYMQWQLDDQENWAFRVNSDIFLGRNPGFAMTAAPRAKRMFRGSIPYYEVVHRVKFYPPPNNPAEESPLNWQPQLLDQGLCRLAKVPELNPGTPVPIFKGPEKISQPVLLDGTGGEAVADANGVITPKYRSFRVYKSTAFAPLLGGGQP